jgi:ABC-type branched-subunit amino acid transport system ATPase component
MMSGGQQQMLAIGRALARPRLLMLDEPSLGLAPRIVQVIFAIVAEINRAGTTVRLVEQNTRQALALAGAATCSRTAGSCARARAAICSTTSTCSAPTSGCDPIGRRR